MEYFDFEKLYEYGISFDDNGFLIKDDSQVVDGFGQPIESNDIGAVIDMDKAKLYLDDDDVIINEKGVRLSTYIEKSIENYDCIVYVGRIDGNRIGLLRDRYPAIADFINGANDEYIDDMNFD